MRKVLKDLLNDINNPNNEDRLYDLLSLYSLYINGEIYQEEIKEIKESM